jgi:hypothetical protein
MDINGNPVWTPTQQYTWEWNDCKLLYDYLYINKRLGE